MSLEDLLELLTSELDRPVSPDEVLSRTCDSLDFFSAVTAMQNAMDKSYAEVSFIGKTVAEIHTIL